MLPWQSEAASAAQLAAVRDTRLGELVRDNVVGLILSGALRPGSRISEPEIAARLGVSRVPVREALREVESAGLVVARKHAGVFVREIDEDEVRGLYALRALLDGYAGRCAAGLDASARLALAEALDASIAAMQQAARRRDVGRYYPENLRFHWLIVEAAGNRPLAATYRGVVEKLHLARLKNLSKDTGMRASIAEHRGIAAALRAGAAPRCEALAAAHVHDACRRLAEATAQPPASDPPVSRRHP